VHATTLNSNNDALHFMKKPVICQLCNFSPETPGTFVDAIVSLARYCHDGMQIETFCIFPDSAQNKHWLQIFDEEGIRYGLVPRRRNVVSKIRQLLEDYDPLIFHTHFSLYDLCPVFLKLMYYKTAKIVWHYHNPTGPTRLQRLKDFVKLQIIARNFSDRCIAVGDGVHQSLIGAGFPPEKLILIHNGINTQRFCPDNNLRKFARESVGVSDGHTVYLLLGWAPVRKGVDIFVKAALNVVRKSNPNSLFLIVGGRETREFVANIPETSRPEPSLRVIDPHADFALVLNGIDVLVSCSRSEGFSYAVSEAMAAGKLIICSDIPGVRDVYGTLKGVWLFPTEKWRELAVLMQRAEKLLGSEREHLGHANREYIVANHSLETWTEKIGEIYRSLLPA
jgi:glycosyltransferase involved in cell wall biosynthesis